MVARATPSAGDLAPDTLPRVRTIVVQHPLVDHKLTTLRDETTDSATLRLLVEELVTLLAYEATQQLRTTSVTITTPLRHEP